MSKVYSMLISKDREMKTTGETLFYALDENGINDFIFYHLHYRHEGKLPKKIRSKIANIIASGKYKQP